MIALGLALVAIGVLATLFVLWVSRFDDDLDFRDVLGLFLGLLAIAAGAILLCAGIVRWLWSLAL